MSDNIQISIEELKEVVSVSVNGTTEDVTVNVTESDNSINLSVAEFMTVSGSSNQITDSEIEALGYIKTDTNTQLSQSDIEAMGFSTFDDVLSDSDITALGYIKTDTNTQLSDLEVEIIIATNSAGFVTTDNNTQLSDADITALGYIKTDTNTQLNDSDITALGYIKTDNNTQLTDAEISALGYVKGNLTNHYLKVSMASSHLKGGASRVDFDNATNTLVLGLTQDDVSGTFISFANNKFTVSEAGMYTFNASAEFESLNTQRVMPAVTFKLNGTTIDGKSMAYVRQAGNVDEGSINLNRTLILSSGDEIEVFSANQGLTSNSVVSTALMFMVEAYTISFT